MSQKNETTRYQLEEHKSQESGIWKRVRNSKNRCLKTAAIPVTASSISGLMAAALNLTEPNNFNLNLITTQIYCPHPEQPGTAKSPKNSASTWKLAWPPQHMHVAREKK